LALSADLFHWQRLGLATFGPYQGIEFGDVDDKDASLFLSLFLIHADIRNWPSSPAAFPRHSPGGNACHAASRELDLDRESIWISYCPMVLENREPNRFGQFTSHHRLAARLRPGSGSKLVVALRHPNSARLAIHLPRRERTG